MRRAPTSILVVDANIVISACLGRIGTALLLEATQRYALRTTQRAREEALGRFKDPRIAAYRPRLDTALAIVPVLPHHVYEALLPEAEAALAQAVASGNGSTTDAHLLATAWVLGCDIWSHDRDFAGTGVSSWSTRNLMSALAAASLDPPPKDAS
ncbi:PIN domain-containing protein [Sabulicella glaciei]|uniref:PIN domain-containing protein n=1 Tax=Sabulicella glaciei TaxID=2984948 RepID=A0ABT3NZI0_9PROT|nr:PIN domain-containing protein [Roseococcus sp. MDT2-1-1]MCW8087561.1 PIN domain-containing protein [Roseococcus sp. MDT2-1-1]